MRINWSLILISRFVIALLTYIVENSVSGKDLEIAEDAAKWRPHFCCIATTVMLTQAFRDF